MDFSRREVTVAVKIRCESRRPRLSEVNDSRTRRSARSIRLGDVFHGEGCSEDCGQESFEGCAAPTKPVKQTLTKSALINLIAEENEIPRKTAAGVYATLENLFLGSVHPRGVGEFVLPGLLKVGLRKVPARRAGTLVQSDVGNSWEADCVA